MEFEKLENKRECDECAMKGYLQGQKDAEAKATYAMRNDSAGLGGQGMGGSNLGQAPTIMRSNNMGGNMMGQGNG